MDEDLPRAHVKRIVKSKLNALDNVDAKGQAFEPNIQKDALTAHGECAKIFIHYITATANEICRDHRRQTVSAEDVLRAIEECDFGEIALETRAALETWQRSAKRKRDEKKEDEGDDAGDEKDGVADGDGEDAGDGEQNEAEDAEEPNE